MNAYTLPIMHQPVYDRTCRAVGHHLRGGRGKDFIARLKAHPAKARSYVDIVTNEMLLRAQVSAIQRDRAARRRAGGDEVLYFLDCDALALLHATTLAELAEAAATLHGAHSSLVLKLHDGFQCLLRGHARAAFVESICGIRELGVKIALEQLDESAWLVRLLQRLGCIDYLFLDLAGVRYAPSAAQAVRASEMRDLMMEQINARGILFVAAGMDTEYASALAEFLPFTYWIGSCLCAAERI